MAHIELAQPMPGIVGLLITETDTAAPLTDLAEMLLRGRASETFTSAEREMVAAYVSWLNQCVFCSESHAAAANHHAKKANYAQSVWSESFKSPTPRMEKLLAIAKKVQSMNFKSVTRSDVEAAKNQGATERDIHDTVLIAAAFCMYNRYVDGLGTICPPRNDEMYKMMGAELADVGYKRERN